MRERGEEGPRGTKSVYNIADLKEEEGKEEGKEEEGKEEEGKEEEGKEEAVFKGLRGL